MKRLVMVWLSMLWAAPAIAEDPAASCTSTTGMLGVSRVAEIDTTGGPAFGDQYPGHFLQPGEVVLTFDDGPFPVYTEEILAALAAECTKATFFQVGSMASHYPDIAKKVLVQGHTIGTHTWSHANLGGRSAVSAKSQVERAITAESTILDGAVAPFFRFPYLSDSRGVRAYLAQRNIAVFSIDVDSFDYRTRTADRIVQNVMNGLAKKGGGIILLHDIHAVTAKAVPMLLAALKAKDFKVVHMVPKALAQPVASLETSSIGDAAALKPAPKRRVPMPKKVEAEGPWLPW